LVAGRRLITYVMQYLGPFLGVRQRQTVPKVVDRSKQGVSRRDDQKRESGPYLPVVLGIFFGAIIVWFVLTKDVLFAIIAFSILFTLWLAAVNFRFGFAGFAAALPTVVFFVIFFLYPIRHTVGPDFFSVTAQTIPVLFIAFAIESGVVRHRTRIEVKALAVLIAVLLALGEAAALLGLAAGESHGFSNAKVWHLTMAVAALAAGFLSIIVSMLIREPEEVPAGAPAASPAVVAGRLRASRPQRRNIARRIFTQRRLATANAPSFAYQTQPKAAHRRPRGANRRLARHGRFTPHDASMPFSGVKVRSPREMRVQGRDAN
jgi:hypothetical protein